MQASAFRAEHASYQQHSEPAKQTERMIEVRVLLMQVNCWRHRTLHLSPSLHSICMIPRHMPH